MQNSILKKLLLITIISTGVSAVESMLTEAKLKELKQSTKALDKSTITIKEGMDRDSVYFLKLETKTKRGSKIMTAFVDKKTGAVYFGKGYDRDGKQISFPKDISIIKEGISFSYGNGKKDLYIVTDPECPYCIKFEKASKGKLKEYRVHVILYPLPYHKKAPVMVEWIMQGSSEDEKKSRLHKVMAENSMEYKSLIIDPKKPFILTESNKRMVERSRKAMSELGARGTPATFDANFKPLSWGALVR